MFSQRHRLLHSESFRQALYFAILFGAAMTFLVGVIYLLLDHSLKQNLLREVGDDIASLRVAYVTAQRGDEVHEVVEMIRDRVRAPDDDDAILLQAGNRVMTGNLPAMPARRGTFTIQLPPSKAAGGRTQAHVFLGRGEFLVKGLYVFVGRDLDQIVAVERHVMTAFGAVCLSSIVLALFSGLFLGRTFLGRIDAVTRTCRSIMEGRLDERIPAVRRSGEFNRLGGAINEMLDQIQALMASLRQVTTDIAHDMRTPLNHLRNRLERARNGAASPAETAAVLDSAIADCDRMLTIFSGLLRIAQIESGVRRKEFCDVDLLALAQEARDTYAPEMEDSGHVFRTVLEPVPCVRGDAQLLRQTLFNLLDNAIAHTPTRSEVVLSCGLHQGVPELCVADRGPGIAAEEYEKVLRPFYRCEQGRSAPGNGLGLSIVAAIAELHGAQVALENNRPGLRIRLSFLARAPKNT